MQLHTKYIEDWGRFLEEYDIDLACGECGGTGTIYNVTEFETCPECDGDGAAEPMWNTVWNTGFSTHRESKLFPAPNVFAFEYEQNIWFGLTGCGMDLTPYLALAWMNTFPDCAWLPEDFCMVGSRITGGYLESCLGKKDARRIYKLMLDSYKSTIINAKHEIKNTRAALRGLRTSRVSK